MAAYNAPVPDVDPVEISIHQLFNQMVFCVNQRREAVLTEYRYLRNEVASRLQTRVRMEAELIKMKTDTERNLQMNKFQELQQQILVGIEQKLAEVRKPQPHTRVVFRSQSAPLEQLIAKLGEVLEEEVMTIPNYLNTRPVVTVGKAGKAPGELYKPLGVAIDTNNRIFIAEGDGSGYARISVFSEEGEYLTSFTHQYFRRPRGITIHGDNLYVTDTRVHAIFQFKIETDFPLVAKQGTKGSQIGEFYYPSNLAVSTHGEVYVTDYNNNRVQILNSSLQHFRSLTEQPIIHPRDIKLTADEVYVLCEDNPCVQVFSHTGEKLRSLVSRGEQMQVSSPYFFCLDAERNIIFSDYVTHQIKIFSKQGNHIRTIGEEGQQPGMFSFPSGLALTKDLSLVVVSHSNNFRMQIFSCL